MFFIKIYIKESYMNYYHTSIQMCGQYCILAPLFISTQNVKSQSIPVHQICPVSSRSHATIDFTIKP